MGITTGGPIFTPRWQGPLEIRRGILCGNEEAVADPISE